MAQKLNTASFLEPYDRPFTSPEDILRQAKEALAREKEIALQKAVAEAKDTAFKEGLFSAEKEYQEKTVTSLKELNEKNAQSVRDALTALAAEKKAIADQCAEVLTKTARVLAEKYAHMQMFEEFTQGIRDIIATDDTRRFIIRAGAADIEALKACLPENLASLCAFEPDETFPEGKIEAEYATGGLTADGEGLKERLYALTARFIEGEFSDGES